MLCNLVRTQLVQSTGLSLVLGETREKNLTSWSRERDEKLRLGNGVSCWAALKHEHEHTLETNAEPQVTLSDHIIHKRVSTFSDTS